MTRKPKEGETMKKQTVYGYDANGYSIGDRVEIHPGCDLWAMGARYGEVTSLAWNMVHVRLDKLPRKVFTAPYDRVRFIDSAVKTGVL